jgi:hypothetical protein
MPKTERGKVTIILGELKLRFDEERQQLAARFHFYKDASSQT